MTLRETSEQNVSSETSASAGPDDAGAHRDTRNKPAPWPRRLLERIKQGERFQACAYFVSTIL